MLLQLYLVSATTDVGRMTFTRSWQSTVTKIDTIKKSKLGVVMQKTILNGSLVETALASNPQGQGAVPPFEQVAWKLYHMFYAPRLSSVCLWLRYYFVVSNPYYVWIFQKKSMTNPCFVFSGKKLLVFSLVLVFEKMERSFVSTLWRPVMLRFVWLFGQLSIDLLVR